MSHTGHISTVVHILNETKITSLECAAHRSFIHVSAPIDAPNLSPFPIMPLTRSLSGNEIGSKGATVLASVLKDTQVVNLECAASPTFVCLLLRQHP